MPSNSLFALMLIVPGVAVQFQMAAPARRQAARAISMATGLIVHSHPAVNKLHVMSAAGPSPSARCCGRAVHGTDQQQYTDTLCASPTLHTTTAPTLMSLLLFDIGN